MALQTGNDPTALLTTALEKLLYLESRLESAEASREEASRHGDRQRQAATQARRSLAEWQRRATDAEVAAEGAEREVVLLRRALGETRSALAVAPTEAQLAQRLEEAEERLRRFERERETWLDRMVSLSRLRGGAADELDLGSFIAELRAELMALRRGEERVRATVSDRPVPPDAAALLAAAPAADVDPATLLANTRLGRPEKTLARLCAADLSSDSSQVRRRAAERLAEAGLAVLNPLVQVRLRTEADPHVRVAMLRLLAQGASEGARLSLSQALADPDPRVRAEAVEALARRDGHGLFAALTDPAPSVRRRALARLPRTGAAIDPLADALHDEDASVRHVAALALGSRPGPEAEAVLLAAAHFADPLIRSLSRASLARRGVAVGEAPVAPAPEPPRAAAPVPEEPWPTGPFTDLLEAPGPAIADEGLTERVLEEIRTNLRGRTPGELVARLGAPEEGVNACLDRLLATGQLVWRGRKLYLP